MTAMISMISHLSLGLLLGALCGYSMTTTRPLTAAFMLNMSRVCGFIFILSTLGGRQLKGVSYPTERLADIVMGGVALSLILCLASVYITRAQRRAQLRLPRSPSASV